MVTFQSAQIIFSAGEENDLVAGGTLFDQLARLCGTISIHIGERIVKDNHATTLREEVVEHSKTERQRLRQKRLLWQRNSQKAHKVLPKKQHLLLKSSKATKSIPKNKEWL